MSIVSTDQAQQHLRLAAGEFDAEDLALKLAAAETAAGTFLNRNVYETKDALDGAIAGAPAALAAATDAYSTAMTAAAGIASDTERAIVECGAREAYAHAQLAARRTYLGIVVNDAIRAAILLTLGLLWENREDLIIGTTAVPLPGGAAALLRPHRISQGV